MKGFNLDDEGRNKKAKLAYNFDHDLPIFFDEKLSEHILDGDRDQTY